MVAAKKNQQKARATLKDIARIVGVSPTAVSLALNGKGSLTAELRSRIKEVSAIMDYHPNSSARLLRGARSNAVAMIINYFNNPFFRKFIVGLESVLVPAGVTYAISQTADNLAREQEQARKLAELGADGLIVLNCSSHFEHLQAVVDSYSIPIVLMSHTLQNHFHAVQADNIRGGYLATEHLLSLDDRPVFHIAGMAGKSGLENRKRGFVDAIRSLRPQVNPEELCFTVDVLTARAGYHAMETICSRHKPPFGVFVVNDDVAMGVLIYCRHHGLSLPDQVAVVGFSDIALLEILDIPLTSIHIPQEQMGALTAQTLLDLIEHPEHRLAPKIQTLPVSLVIRGSTVVRPKTEEREPEFLPDSPG